MPNRNRNVLLKFFVTEEEQAFIHKKTEYMPTKNLSAYLRKMSMDGYKLGLMMTAEAFLTSGDLITGE